MDGQDLARWTRFAAKGGIGKCTATRDCVAQNQDDLMFVQGDEIIVLMQVSDSEGLYLGFCQGVLGEFSGADVQFHGKLKKPRRVIRSLGSAASTSPTLSTRRGVPSPTPSDSPPFYRSDIGPDVQAAETGQSNRSRRYSQILSFFSYKRPSRPSTREDFVDGSLGYPPSSVETPIRPSEEQLSRSFSIKVLDEQGSLSPSPLPDSLVSAWSESEEDEENEEDEDGDPELPMSLEDLMRRRPAIDLNGRVTIPNAFKGIHGGYATVYTGVLDGKPVAVKVLRATKNVENPAEWQRKLQRGLTREINVWAALSHPNISEFLGYTDDFGDFAAMVSKWCNFGTANMYFSKGFIDQKERILLSRDVATGLQYLHDLKIIHGDLKPTNILIGDDRIAQLTDFGLVRLEDWQGPSGMTTTTPYTGTERYKAPELFVSLDNRFPVATFEGDIHALGCICFEFVTHRQPYSEYSNALDLRQAVEERDPPATRPRDINSEFEVFFWNLLQECWSWYPENRPPVAEVVGTLKGLSELQNCH